MTVGRVVGTSVGEAVGAAVGAGTGVGVAVGVAVGRGVAVPAGFGSVVDDGVADASDAEAVAVGAGVATSAALPARAPNPWATGSAGRNPSHDAVLSNLGSRGKTFPPPSLMFVPSISLVAAKPRLSRATLPVPARL
jgi:hypothetical protein